MIDSKTAKDVFLHKMLGAFLNKQKQALDFYFESIKIPCFIDCLNVLAQCSGTVVFSGIGKSALVAKKISATFNSYSIKSAFLCPVGAMHGDMGFINDKDVLLVFSKSGESDEILQMMPFLKKKGVFLISVVCKENSRLKSFIDLEVLLPSPLELCPFDLAPTNSTVFQMLFGDCLAVCLMQLKGLSKNVFGFNHPAGFIGKKMSLTVADLMVRSQDLPICEPSVKLVHILHELSAKKCGCILVCSSQKLLGIFTDGDLRRAMEKSGPGVLDQPIDQFMTKNPLSTSPHTLAYDAIEIMEMNPQKLVTVLPVIKDEIVVGLLKLHDIIQAGLLNSKRKLSL